MKSKFKNKVKLILFKLFDPPEGEYMEASLDKWINEERGMVAGMVRCFKLGWIMDDPSLANTMDFPDAYEAGIKWKANYRNRFNRLKGIK